MNRTTRFIVEIITTDKITSDDDKNDMAQNIANAIQKEAQDYGITPEDSDTSATIIYVKEWYSDKQIIEHI